MQLIKEQGFVKKDTKKLTHTDKAVMTHVKEKDFGENGLNKNDYKPVNYYRMEFTPQEMAEGDHRDIYVFHDATVGIIEFQTLEFNVETKIDKLYDVDIKTLAQELSADNGVNYKPKKIGLKR